MIHCTQDSVTNELIFWKMRTSISANEHLSLLFSDSSLNVNSHRASIYIGSEQPVTTICCETCLLACCVLIEYITAH